MKLIALFVAVGMMIVAIGTAWFLRSGEVVARIDAGNAERVAHGEQLYAEHCATCHGAKLEGQSDWRQPLPTGGLPAPPHDETGHTWHHDDQLLFDYTKWGGQALLGDLGQSNMPAFGDQLDDEQIWAVLSFIKAQWPLEVQRMQSQRNPS
jgi:mono/diheme cytochrome c family protein